MIPLLSPPVNQSITLYLLTVSQMINGKLKDKVDLWVMKMCHRHEKWHSWAASEPK